ncbi:MAG: hypothetical protein PHN75_15950, partial [Syntrophales bacterium]|nr:hypothetical protein [Syntrophales bacterium]
MSDLIVQKKTALTGGGATALDGIDGTALQEGEFAFVMVSDVLYVYRLNATSGAAESSPNIIAPDANGGNKRWILQGNYGNVKFPATQVPSADANTLDDYEEGAWTRPTSSESGMSHSVSGECDSPSSQMTASTARPESRLLL